MILLFLLLFNGRIVITEVMSNVKGSDSGTGSPGDRNEFIEIYNQSSDTIDLSDFKISDFDATDILHAWDDEQILTKYPSLRIHSTLIYPYSYALILDPEYTSNDTTGGYSQPYSFPDSTLIITVGNTTIGNGLQTTDPLIIYSTISSDTSTFGTPFDTTDDFPYDPGDGISWERIEITEPDTPNNWHSSLDPTGSTPGQENSASNADDLAIDTLSIIFIPTELKSGEDLQIEIWIKNLGISETNDYTLKIYDDQNFDSILTSDELLHKLPGESILPQDSTKLHFTYEHPDQRTHNLGFVINYPPDKNPANDSVFKTFKVIGDIGLLALSPRVFTPDNDGINDRLQIDYRIPESGGKLTISIFDTRGISIHNLIKNQTVIRENGTLYWDGNISKGKAPTGMYIIYLEYQYQKGLTRAKRIAVLSR